MAILLNLVKSTGGSIMNTSPRGLFARSADQTMAVRYTDTETVGVSVSAWTNA